MKMQIGVAPLLWNRKVAAFLCIIFIALPARVFSSNGALDVSVTITDETSAPAPTPAPAEVEETPNTNFGSTRPLPLPVRETPSVIPIVDLEKPVGDFNSDGLVSCDDFGLFRLHWNGLYNADFDLNNDKVVDTQDLSKMLPYFNTSRCPQLAPVTQYTPSAPEGYPTIKIVPIVFTQNGVVRQVSKNEKVVHAQKGDVVRLGIVLDTGARFINATDVTVAFPGNGVRLIDKSYNSSIFNLWLDEPDIRDELFTLSGGVPGTGYWNEGLSVASFSLAMVRVGAFDVNFGHGTTVFEGDGNGTSLVPEKIGVRIVVSDGALFGGDEELDADDMVVDSPSELITNLRSPSHPSPFEWYNTEVVSMEWDLPTGNAVQFDIDNEPDTVPNTKAEDKVQTSYILADGVWYFHIKPSGSTNEETQHYRIRIDTQAPHSFPVQFTRIRGVLGGTKIIAHVDTYDALSGLSHYEFIEEDGVGIENSEGIYELSDQSIGEHELIVSAVDRAGNTIQTRARTSLTAKPEKEAVSRQILSRAYVIEQTPPVVNLLLSAILVVIAGVLSYIFFDLSRQRGWVKRRHR